MLHAGTGLDIHVVVLVMELPQITLYVELVVSFILWCTNPWACGHQTVIMSLRLG